MIIVLYGADTFRSRRKLTQIKEKFVRDVDHSGINIETINATGATAEIIERALTTQPFLAAKRLVIIEDLLSNAKAHQLHHALLELITEQELNHVVLVFWDTELVAPKKRGGKKTGEDATALYKKLTAERYAQRFDPLDSSGVCAFIAAEVKARGGSFETNAVRLLADIVGSDLWQADGEITKLIAYAQGKTVTTKDVEALVVTKLVDDIFGLTDALSTGNKGRALKLLSDQLAGGASATEVLSAITWQYRALTSVKSFVEVHGKSYPAERIARDVSLHPFVVKKALVATARYTLADLQKRYAYLIESDYKIKTGRATPEALLDLFVVKS